MGKQKVPQGYSPADDNAGSLTPFGMTFNKSEHITLPNQVRGPGTA
ncbi:MAG: hypothetical protein ACXV5R_09925 [Candidatus Angelobacter sp.]